jgi:hypothetical protein
VIKGLDTLGAAHVGAVNVLSSIERLNRAGLSSVFEFPETAQEGGLLGYGT